MHQGIETIIDHFQRIVQVLAPPFAPGQIGKVGRDTRIVRRTIILIEADTLDSKCDIVIHHLASNSKKSNRFFASAERPNIYKSGGFTAFKPTALFMRS